MYFPIAIEPCDATHAFGVVFPDLPGCFSAGDTLEEAIENAKEAASLWLETSLDAGKSIPSASDIKSIASKLEFAGWVISLVDIDLAKLSDKTERINITLPARALRRLDYMAYKKGETRSGFLANLIYSANID